MQGLQDVPGPTQLMSQIDDVDMHFKGGMQITLIEYQHKVKLIILVNKGILSRTILHLTKNIKNIKNIRK